jgi:hypothetical protein
VVAHVTVDEHAEKQSLNTPGGDELMKRVGGPSGLPYFAFLDSAGAVLATSIEPPGEGRKGGNIGHPFQPHEIDWFLVMLAKAAPAMTADERAVLEKYLRAQNK